MSRHMVPIQVGAGEIDDSERPIRVWTRTAEGELVEIELSLVLAWELMIALGEHVAQRPAPVLPPHPYRLRALAAAERPPLGSYASDRATTHPSPAGPPARRPGW